MTREISVGDEVKFRSLPGDITGRVVQIKDVHRRGHRLVVEVDGLYTGAEMEVPPVNLLPKCNQCGVWTMWHENREEAFCPVCER